MILGNSFALFAPPAEAFSRCPCGVGAYMPNCLRKSDVEPL